jgi:hypothetical protein
MKNTQNQKISQIKNETLVVGIDVAKETHYARAFDSTSGTLDKTWTNTCHPGKA